MFSPSWPLTPIRRAFRVFAAGEAEVVLGSQSWLTADTSVVAGDGTHRIRLQWRDDDQRLKLDETADLSTGGQLVSSRIEQPGGDVVELSVDATQATLVGTRVGAAGVHHQTNSIPGDQILVQHMIWPFLFCHLMWQPGQTFRCCLASVGHRADTPTVFSLAEAAVSVVEDSIAVDIQGVHTVVPTWRVDMAGSNWSAAVQIGKTNEGPLRIDFNSTHSGLLIARAG